MNWDAIQWTTGIFFSLAGAGWVLIRLWMSAQDKITDLKDERFKQLIEDLKQNTEKLDQLEVGVKEQLQKTALMMKDIESRFALLEERIKNNSSSSQLVTDALREFVRSNDQRIKNIEAALDNVELVKVGKDTYMIKNRRRSAVQD